MRFLAAAATLLAVSVGFVAAQDSNSTYSCAAQNIVDACLESTEPQLKACPPNDWKCLCEQSTNVLTCYNNCPGHPDQFGAEQTKESYCNAAKASEPSSTTTLASTTATSSVAAAAGTPSTTSTSGSSTSTSSSHAAATSSSAAAPGVAVEAGSLLAAVALGLGAAL